MPVINRLYPVPYESLDSLLTRVWRANYYPPSRRSWHGALGEPSAPLALLHDPADLGAIAAFTGLTLARLRACTLHRFAPRYLWPEDVAATAVAYGPGAAEAPVPFWRAVDRRPFVDERGALCPVCWQEQAVLLLPWALRHVTTCPRHQVLLVDHCDGCGRRLRVDPLCGACQGCGRPYADLRARALGDHRLSHALGTAMWSLVGCGPRFPPRALRLPRDHPLRRLLPASILLFVWLAARALPAPFGDDPDDPLAARPSTAVADDGAAEWVAGAAVDAWAWGPRWPWPLTDEAEPRPNVARMHAALVTIWRQVLHAPAWGAGLAAYRTHTAQIRALKRRHVRRMAADDPEPVWSWLHEGWLPDPVQARLQQEGSIYRRLWAHACPFGWRLRALDLPPSAPLLPAPEAAHRLRLATYALRLVGVPGADAERDRRRREGPWAGTPPWWQDAHDDPLGPVDLDLDAAAALCGVDALEVVALVAAGFLEARAGPLVDGSATYRFTRAALRRCPVASASYPVLPDPLPRIVVSLAAALRLLATADADAADAAGRADAGRVRLPQVLAAVQTGALQAFRAAWDRGWSHAPLPLAALWIVRDDVLRYRALAAWRVRDPLQSAAAVCRSLRCTPATLRHLYGRAELVPARDATDLTTIRWQYEPWAVEQFARRHPTDREAAQLLGTTTRAVRRLVEARRLFPVTGPRLDGSACYRVGRVDVYRLRDGHLTDAALRDLLSDW